MFDDIKEDTFKCIIFIQRGFYLTARIESRAAIQFDTPTT